ncbi:MAG: hypothetical protein SNJ56_03270, partial [Termitinemataceae bacterium]
EQVIGNQQLFGGIGALFAGFLIKSILDNLWYNPVTTEDSAPFGYPASENSLPIRWVISMILQSQWII